MPRALLALAAAVMAVAALALPAQASPAEAAREARLLIARATATVERLRADETFREHFEPHLRRAKAVLVMPSFTKAGLILGGAYGNGVLLVRGADGWSAPAFYRMYEGSVGLQIGAQQAEIVFLIMSDGALQALMDNSFKFGAGFSVTVATVGAGMEAATTTNVGADVIAFARAAGMFGGGALEGAWVEERLGYAASYYGRPIGAREIVREGGVSAPEAERLRALLAE